jgi:HEAT repeat protein
MIGVGAIDAIPALVNTLNNDLNLGVRLCAAEALGAMGPAASAAVPALINSLRYGNAGYSGGASTGLAHIGLPAVPALIAALKCNYLGPRTPMSETAYQGPVYPEIENVRVGAAAAFLGMDRLAARAAIPALTEALRDEHPRVRDTAARALKEIQRR